MEYLRESLLDADFSVPDSFVVDLRARCQFVREEGNTSSRVLIFSVFFILRELGVSFSILVDSSDRSLRDVRPTFKDDVSSRLETFLMGSRISEGSPVTGGSGVCEFGGVFCYNLLIIFSP